MGTFRRIAERSLKGNRGIGFFSATQHCVIKMKNLMPLNTTVTGLKKFSDLFRRSCLNM